MVWLCHSKNTLSGHQTKFGAFFKCFSPIKTTILSKYICSSFPRNIITIYVTYIILRKLLEHFIIYFNYIPKHPYVTTVLCKSYLKLRRTNSSFCPTLNIILENYFSGKKTVEILSLKVWIPWNFYIQIPSVIPLFELNLGAILPRMGPKCLGYHIYEEVVFKNLDRIY